MKNFLIGLCVSIAIVVCCCSCDDSNSFSVVETKSVEQYRSEIVHTMNSVLKDKDNHLHRRVESAHGTVTVYKAFVSHCEIVMHDTSGRVKKDESNVKQIRMEITFYWNGIIHQGGHTVLRLILDNAGDEWMINTAKIVETDALVNTEDPDFWIGVGSLLLMSLDE